MSCKSNLFFVLTIWLFFTRSVLAIQVETLDSAREWRVRNIQISGNERFSDSRLLDELLTESRPWYRFWEARPVFDPITFQTDLERLHRFYESEGYYQNRITHDLGVDDAAGLVDVRILVEENQPVLISQVVVDVSADSDYGKFPRLPEKLAVVRGEIFKEEEYQDTEMLLRNLLMENGHAHARTERRAEVDLDESQASIRYSVQPGPKTVFGETVITGTEQFDPYLISRELAYEPGESFSLQKIRETRQKILALDLFSGFRINPQETAGMPAQVPMMIDVSEKPPREINVSLGYSTEEEFRVALNWRHQNWLGDGRRLSVETRYSSIITTGAVEFIQPHFLSPRNLGGLTFRQDLEDEKTYDRNATKFSGRLERRFSQRLIGFVGYRAEYNHLNNVSAATSEALGDFRREGILTGPSLGLIWNSTDDLLYPTRGEVLSFSAEQAGALWGGQYDLYKLTGEAKKYLAIGWETILAGRLKIGLADAIGSRTNFPLFERFYAGGQASVRGFERRRLGPRNSDDDPLGGLSLIEGSVEVRRPIWRQLGGALFVDFGQLSLQPFDVPIDDLQFAGGFGLSYTTPVGPIRLDVGFPFQPRRGDQAWQIHFSIGASF